VQLHFLDRGQNGRSLVSAKAHQAVLERIISREAESEVAREV
jgi:hypothetical protein